MTYQAVVKQGHTGAGKYLEKIVFIKAKDILEAMDIAKGLGGVKKGHLYNTGASVIDIKAIN